MIHCGQHLFTLDQIFLAFMAGLFLGGLVIFYITVMKER